LSRSIARRTPDRLPAEPLIDCPPNLGLLCANALAAAEEVLVPVETHGIAAIGLSDLLGTEEDARIPHPIVHG
jgi:cellulose biosynthesis protein BcsQ